MVIEVINDDAWIQESEDHVHSWGGQIMLVWSSKTEAGHVDCLFPQKYQLNCTLQKRQLETKLVLATTVLAGSVIALA